MDTDVLTLLLIGLFLLFLVLVIIVWAFRFAAVLAAAFTAFMFELPLIIMLLVFILFPPTLIVFLIGWFVLGAGLVDEEGKVAKAKGWETEDERDARIRHELGYDRNNDESGG